MAGSKPATRIKPVPRHTRRRARSRPHKAAAADDGSR